ncbi:MAG: glycine cleavage system protein GcvH [Planctomycetota bacterium]|jgi:glycine cleavage system H protein|nr:glycine cleavage system protein GcvH [Planctomycetota bacterium]
MKDFSELVTPATLRYAKDHEWISPAAPHRVGVSDFAQDQLGDLTYVELPDVGRVLSVGDEFGSLESIKSVSSLYAPVAGKVAAVNEKLRDDPGLVNRDPYGEGWIIEVEPADAGQFAALMTGDAYSKHVKDNA